MVRCLDGLAAIAQDTVQRSVGVGGLLGGEAARLEGRLEFALLLPVFPGGLGDGHQGAAGSGGSTGKTDGELADRLGAVDQGVAQAAGGLVGLFQRLLGLVGVDEDRADKPENFKGHYSAPPF